MFQTLAIQDLWDKLSASSKKAQLKSLYSLRFENSKTFDQTTRKKTSNSFDNLCFDNWG